MSPHARTPLIQRLSEAIAAEDPRLRERLADDPAAYLELVAVTAEADEATGDLLRAAVASARTAGHSWEAIGQVLGMTRQAVQQRFGGRRPEQEGPTTRLLSPVTAFTEMEALARAGREGWHSVGYGALFHLLQRSDQQWEHLRLFLADQAARTLEKQGWQRIGSGWFPWVYLKRPLGLPPEPAGA